MGGEAMTVQSLRVFLALPERQSVSNLHRVMNDAIGDDLQASVG
jgi:hypothetical protein